MTRIINFFGGPGCGKSTVAARLFALMKGKGMNVELVTEYAKDLTWDKSYGVLNDQLLVTAEQNHRIERLDGTVDWIVTDSPILLGLAYLKDPWPEFEQMLLSLWHRHDNHAVLVNRVKPYMPVGRSQSEESTRSLDQTTHDLARLHTEWGHLWSIEGSEFGALQLHEEFRAMGLLN